MLRLEIRAALEAAKRAGRPVGRMAPADALGSDGAQRDGDDRPATRVAGGPRVLEPGGNAVDAAIAAAAVLNVT